MYGHPGTRTFGQYLLVINGLHISTSDRIVFFLVRPIFLEEPIMLQAGSIVLRTVYYSAKPSEVGLILIYP